MSPPTTYLHLLPVELWIACWTLCSHRQLRRISLVCQLFRSLCLPLVFQDQTFDVAALGRQLTRNNWMDRVRHLHRTAVRLDRLIESPYAHFVRSWKVTLPHSSRISPYHPDIQNIHVFDTTYDRVVTTFCRTLEVYQNLSSLYLQRFTIDTAFRTTLISLPRLQTLTLSECNMVDQHGFLNLGSLTLISPRDLGAPEGPLQIASPDTLRTLTLNLSSPIASLVTGFGPKDLPHLIHLTIDALSVAHLDTLVRFLDKCPRLESLAINSVSGIHPTSPVPHSNTIPLLHTFAGPPSLIQLFVPNRPVSRVTVMGAKWKDNSTDITVACMAISHSTRPLHYLALPCIAPKLDFLISITHLFPELQELTAVVEGYIRGHCGGVFGRRPIVTTVDSESLDLCDDDAFDNPKTDEVSDDEPEEYPTAIPTTGYIPPNLLTSPEMSAFSNSGVREIVRWIVAGQLTLPPSIEVFQLEAEGSVLGLSLAEQQAAVVVLGTLCPGLCQLQFGGSSNHWRRDGGLWKGEVQRTGYRRRTINEDSQKRFMSMAAGATKA
ncbi:hypothetical protein B0H17DRAFT_376541 [Mycena rosella]|uniref:F-box domain-containing protein n=1 Tax=Mycena rosella TaxID=1033263 RepID=A0AAD7DTC1_MYCRO|nr:hypothetical protein B0H17DRAFT_376541 [Mycena rosella]